MISDSSFNLKNLLRLFFSNSENLLLSLNRFLSCFYQNTTHFICFVKSKLETLEAVEEAKVKPSGLGWSATIFIEQMNFVNI
jgi:hypothetical protein